VLKAVELGEITQNNGHYAIQGHRYGINRKPMRLAIAINTNSRSIYHRFQVIADYGYKICAVDRDIFV